MKEARGKISVVEHLSPTLRYIAHKGAWIDSDT